MSRSAQTAGDDLLQAVERALRPLVRKRARSRICADASLVRDLGMDSLKVVELSLSLEEALCRPVFLPAWISSVDDPDDLTVASLVAFVARPA
jgi:hypothetical protein